MSRSYTPGLKVLSKTKIIVNRLLPMKGNVHYDIGDNVKADDIVASTEIPGNVQMLNISKQLNIEPENIPECMLVKLDDSISKGQVIAESKGLFGLFKNQLKSPIDGILVNISEITGQAILSEPPQPVEIDAYVSGKIKDIINKEGVIVETEGVLIQGILGLGGESRGELVVLVDSPEDELTVEMILPEHKNKIIVGGSFMGHEVFNRAKKIGVSGIITGGFDYQNLSKILGFSLGVAITGSEQIGPSIMITEGFGNISMAKRTFSLLKENKNHYASLNGSTQIRAGVIRPELVIPMENLSLDETSFSELDLVISVGSMVRVIREPYFGNVGKVISLPTSLEKMESETEVRVAEVDFGDGNIKTIPRANLEMILS